MTLMSLDEYEEIKGEVADKTTAFKKDAEEYIKANNLEWELECHRTSPIGEVNQAFQKGAEFGYNKANEWNIETPSSALDNKDLLLRVAKDDSVVGYYHFEKKRFYTNDGQEVIPLAWKEIHYPKESE